MRTHGPGLRLPLLIAFGVALALLTSTPATAQVDCGATFPECNGECPPGLFCLSDSSGTGCVCTQPAGPCEEAVHPECDGECPPDQICDPDPAFPFCVCRPLVLPCENSFLAGCEGECPLNQECRHIPGTENCECVEAFPPCGDAVYPTCDGLCPPNEDCVENLQTMGCRCEPTAVTCDQSPHPVCDGTCPPGEVCLGINGTSCECLPETDSCDQSAFPACDAPCPAGEVCINDGSTCRCEPEIVACDLAPFPTCDGTCPPTEICVSDGFAACFCQPDTVACEQSDPLVCDGPCPNTNEVCTIDPVGGPCFCEVPQLPCEQTSPPTCDGFCTDPTEVCTPVVTDVILTSPELPPESDPPDCDQLVSQYEGQGVHVLFPGGVDLSDPIHRCFRNVFREASGSDEIETFESTLEALVDLGAGPIAVTLAGPVMVVTSDKVGQTTGTFDTEIVSMSLSGVVGGTPIEIRESPTLVSAGQTTITDLGGGLYHIDSFFDVFTELSVDGGSFQPQINEAARMTLVPTAPDSCACQPVPCEQSPFPLCDGECPPGTFCFEDPAGATCRCEPEIVECEQSLVPLCDGECPPDEICAPVVTDVILTSPELPPESDPPDCDQLVSQYEGQGVHVLFPGGIDLSDPIHRCFRNVFREAIGADEIETFESTLEALVDLGAGPIAVTLAGPVMVVTSDKVGQTTGTFATEIISMSLSGVVGSTMIEIRESPSLASQGQTTITDLGGGLYQIDSFFDVFTELSVDGGSFQPQINEAARMTLVPTAPDSCACQPVPCEQSPFPLCDGECPPGTFCLEDPASGSCICQVESCEMKPYPVCDGPCPPGTVCVTDGANQLCICEPEIVPCEQTVFPVCDGDCPTDEICVPDSVTGHCRCEPLVMCEQSPFPECDGACPPGDICAPDLFTGLCRCIPIEEPCEFALFPQCDGQCPPDELCFDDDPSGVCLCEPLFPCETAMFPECEGACPPDEECVEVPGANFCRCEPVPMPFCDEALAPVCDGNCPPDERCTPVAVHGFCECIPCVFVVPGWDIEILWPDKDTIDWNGTECALYYNVYRQTALRLQDADANGLADSYGTCFLFNIPVTQAPDLSSPAQGFTNYYLVTGENFVGEGSMGFNSNLQERPNLFPCP